ncbi:hypothetical protein PENSPDRAFT_635072 [Peniophora sp. CONT]|nr:hypothetical protein PENSPDRAFT_635072 [Peniophora sp. CONT]
MPPFSFTPSPVFPEFEEFHASIWGREWPKSEIRVEATEPTTDPQPVLAPPSDDDPVVRIIASVEPGVSASQNYNVFSGLKDLALNLGISGAVGDLLVVREEYKLLHQRLLTGDLQAGRYRCLLVTGQPGIGKTTFLLFLFIQRMQARLPTAIQFKADEYCIFNERGVILRKDMARMGVDPELAECWALADSNDGTLVPCRDFRTPIAQRLIQTTSPRPDRWKDWAKYTGAMIVIMDLPNALDVAAVANYVEAIGLMDEWGPSIRTIMNNTDTLMKGLHRSNVRTAAIELANKDVLKTLLKDRSMAAIGALDSKCFSLIFLRPKRLLRAADEPGQPQDVPIYMAGTDRIVEHVGQSTLTIPTHHLHAIYEKHRGEITDEEAFQLFKVLSTHPLTRGATAWRHEGIVHRRIRFDEPALEIAAIDGEKAALPSARRVRMCLVSTLNVVGLDDSVYWIPAVSNFPGIDCVLFADRNLYAVQAAISLTHRSPIDGLKKVWQNLNANVRGHFTWHVVFITRELPYDGHVRRWDGELSVGRNTVKVWGCTLSLNDQSGGDNAEDDDDY